MDYNPRDIEKKWQKYWVDQQVYKVENDTSKPKYYVLDMFPYPSGAGLHVGHPLGYIASDIYARYKRLKGFNVLHPMGYDAFGLPAEQYALQTGIHPAVSTDQNINRYREQLDNLGFSFDWSREVKTCDPSYYKWTQWIFTQLFEHYYDKDQDKAVPLTDLEATFEKEGNANVNAATTQKDTFSAEEWKAMSKKEQRAILMNYRLAYRDIGYVNWCDELGTVLANDQVKDGVSERGGYPVVQKAMTMWALRTTAYADRLLYDLDNIDWSDALKTMQRNWIGRSEGATVFFEVEGSDKTIEIFTTRPDTIFGATFMVLAPEHPLVAELTTAAQQQTVDDYLKYTQARSDLDRMSEVKEVTGAFIGAYAINPFTNTKIPIWIGEYVLLDYGTGAIMAVPSDDDRDHAFATKFDLEIIDVVDKTDYPGATKHDKLGKIINSDFINGMEVPEAITKMCEEIEARGLGKAKVNYKLRDANFSRQRYWGEPFPIVFDEDDLAYALPVEELPLELPATDDFKPTADGKSPLARQADWVNAKPGFTRETDTMPAVAGSSWYYLRYMDSQNNEAFAGQDAVNYWQDVDLYIGGSEHAVAHLLYARFWHKFLFDKGLVPTNEPFKKLINQGMIQGVIEFLTLQKEKVDGYSRFVCADIAKKEEETGTEFAKIPIHVDYVKDYGTSSSYVDIDSIKKFIDWRPEYQDAIFECGSGVYHKGVFTPHQDAEGSHLVTVSEVGKMSKRYFNVVNPDDVVERYGTDCFRMYEMFLGPVEQAKPWDTKGIDGVIKFLRRFWGMFFDDKDQFNLSDVEATKDELKVLHTAIKKVNEDIERFSFNTCVSAFMVVTNDLKKLNCNKRSVLEPLVRLIAPFAPHMAEELWHQLGNEGSVHLSDYPEANEEYLKEDAIAYPISINGKKRALAEFPVDASKEDLEKWALALEDIQKWTDGKTIRKVIVVPKRMINIVVG
jgi:leucyl-tRNA synthetase